MGRSWGYDTAKPGKFKPPFAGLRSIAQACSCSSSSFVLVLGREISRTKDEGRERARSAGVWWCWWWDSSFLAGGQFTERHSLARNSDYHRGHEAMATLAGGSGVGCNRAPAGRGGAPAPTSRARASADGLVAGASFGTNHSAPGRYPLERRLPAPLRRVAEASAPLGSTPARPADDRAAAGHLAHSQTRPGHEHGTGSDLVLRHAGRCRWVDWWLGAAPSLVRRRGAIVANGRVPGFSRRGKQFFLVFDPGPSQAVTGVRGRCWGKLPVRNPTPVTTPAWSVPDQTVATVAGGLEASPEGFLVGVGQDTSHSSQADRLYPPRIRPRPHEHAAGRGHPAAAAAGWWFLQSLDRRRPVHRRRHRQPREELLQFVAG